ncbi:YqhA family protein [Methanolobus zinderi]|uniref:YqhA family protein n=1 Tax=Methanolobus zinderi TaxID=536044 RepID=A0A7D5IP96_9EURY|nr:YqhA family protein [Methanolobus zinderi]QLC49727.1 YqhA family protein [Methanolobus zinderi]
MSALYAIVAATRYLVIIPVIGLIIAAALLFVVGGLKLLEGVYMAIVNPSSVPTDVSVIGIVEFVHLFLIGTVLWITAIGLYQLFIHQMPLPKWLQINDIEELETDLIGMVVVVLAVNFLGVVFNRTENILEYGAAIALPIAALALYINVRGKRSAIHEKIVTSESAEITGDTEES